MSVSVNSIQLTVNGDYKITPADLLIRRVKTSNNLFVNYFDIGLAPEAIRVYVRNELINFLMNLGKIQRLSTNLFLARYLSNSQVKIKARDENNETLVVNAGEFCINSLLFSSAIDLEEQLENIADDVLIDYYTFNASDTLIHYILLLQYQNELIIRINEKDYILRMGELINNVEKEGRKVSQPKLNKAGIPILD